MLLLDEAGVNEDGTGFGVYRVTGGEYFLQGHFPGNPVVPGVILCEIMGQSSCVLLQDKLMGATPYFTGINKVKMRQKVVPGDVFTTRVTLLNEKKPFYFIEASGYVGGRLVISGELSFAAIKDEQAEQR